MGLLVLVYIMLLEQDSAFHKQKINKILCTQFMKSLYSKASNIYVDSFILERAVYVK
jgi:hypothetical protein